MGSIFPVALSPTNDMIMLGTGNTDQRGTAKKRSNVWTQQLTEK